MGRVKRNKNKNITGGEIYHITVGGCITDGGKLSQMGENRGPINQIQSHEEGVREARAWPSETHWHVATTLTSAEKSVSKPSRPFCRTFALSFRQFGQMKCRFAVPTA